MAEETIVRTLRDGTITISDGTSPTALTYTVAFEVGDLQYTPGSVEVLEFLDRNQHASPPALRYGEDGQTTGSFTAYLRQVTDASEIVLNDILHQSGYFASDWVSTLDSAGNAEVKTVQIQLAVEGSDHGGTDTTITFPHCFVRGSVAEGTPTQLSIEFTSYANYPTLA